MSDDKSIEGFNQRLERPEDRPIPGPAEHPVQQGIRLQHARKMILLDDAPNKIRKSSGIRKISEIRAQFTCEIPTQCKSFFNLYGYYVIENI